MTLSEFRHVRSSIQPHIRTTPIVPSELSNLYLKLENLQHTHSFKIPCIVVVPANAPRNKIEAIRKYGADLRIEGANYDEAEAWTLDLARNTNDYAFVSPYNDRLVILGQGT